MRPTNYLNNKDILKEIHKSKISFSYFVDDEYSTYDMIITDLSEINSDIIRQAKINKLDRLSTRGRKKIDIGMTVDDIKTEDVVFRMTTYDHIPPSGKDKAKIKKLSDGYVKLNFIPFKHYIIRDGEFVEVGRSHWKNGLENGEFCQTHGSITNTLANMFILLVERFSSKFNWRGYTYRDEMQGQAILQLVQEGLRFDESKYDNPFAYYTMMVTNSFRGVLITEKRNQKIRDDILELHGVNPSMTRQIENDIAKSNSE